MMVKNTRFKNQSHPKVRATIRPTFFYRPSRHRMDVKKKPGGSLRSRPAWGVCRGSGDRHGVIGRGPDELSGMNKLVFYGISAH